MAVCWANWASLATLRVDPNQAMKIPCGRLLTSTLPLAAKSNDQGQRERNRQSQRCHNSATAAPQIATAGIDSDQRCSLAGHAKVLPQQTNQREIAMKQVALRSLLAAAVIICAVSGSIGWSRDNGLSLSVEGAQARVGRPLTPVSVAGVARRTTRRAVVGGAAVGAAVAAPGCVRVVVNGRYVCR